MPKLTFKRFATMTLAMTALGAFSAANAQEALLYAGGAVGLANTDVGQIVFNQNALGWKAFVGTHPISLLGAEVSYLNLGSPNRTIQGIKQSASTKGMSAFGMIYVPQPLPSVDFYGKLGLARLQADANAYEANCGSSGSGCSLFSFSTKNTTMAYGFGAQAHWGAIAARLEYEHFHTAGGLPSMWTAGLSYGFL